MVEQLPTMVYDFFGGCISFTPPDNFLPSQQKRQWDFLIGNHRNPVYDALAHTAKFVPAPAFRSGGAQSGRL